MQPTLKDLRNAAGLTLQQALDRIREIEPSAPTTIVGLKHIENRGTDRLKILRAMAVVYQVDRSVVEQAAGNITDLVVSA